MSVVNRVTTWRAASTKRWRKDRKNLGLRIPKTMRAQFAVVHSVVQAKIDRQFVCRASCKLLSGILLLLTQLVYPEVFEADISTEDTGVVARYYMQSEGGCP